MAARIQTSLQLILLSALIAACSANRFTGAIPPSVVGGNNSASGVLNQGSSGDASGSVHQSGGENPATGTIGQGATVGSGSLTLTQPAVVPCVIKQTQVLVIDLKSGWWAGDGAQTFNNIAKYVSSQCAQVTMEYGHMTVAEELTSAKKFPSKPFAAYDEIWVLSGNEIDDADLRLTSDTFQRFVTGITNSSANVLIGAGSGAIYHANAVAQAMGLGTPFVKGAQTGTGLVPLIGFSDTVSIASAITSGLTGPLFKNVNALADTVRINSQTFVTDKLLAAAPITAVATNSAGVTEIGTATVGTRKIVLDSDLARMYPILTTEQNTRNYMVNLLSYLQR